MPEFLVPEDDRAGGSAGWRSWSTCAGLPTPTPNTAPRAPVSSFTEAPDVF